MATMEYLLCVGTMHGVSAVILVGKTLLIKPIMGLRHHACQVPDALSLKFKKKFHLAPLGLNCVPRDLCCILQHLSMGFQSTWAHAVAALGCSCSSACGILVL